MHVIGENHKTISSESSPTMNDAIEYVHLLEPINIVCVGDEGVGKTCCLLTYSDLISSQQQHFSGLNTQVEDSVFNRSLIPSVMETIRKEVIVPKTALAHCKFVNGSAMDQSISSTLSFANCEGFRMNINLMDTPGDEEQSDDRVHHYYTHAHVFVLIFALNDITSFERVADFWAKEIKQTVPHPCMIIVGNKSDVNSEERHVKRLDGLEMQNKIGAKMYMEVSALNSSNIVNLVDACVRLGTKELDAKCAHLLYKQDSHPSRHSNTSSIHGSTHSSQSHSLSQSISDKDNSCTKTVTTTPVEPTLSAKSSSQCPHLTKQHSLSPLIIEKEFRFGVELLPKIFLENDPESIVLKSLNYKIKKIIKAKIDINMNPICQLKRCIISVFGRENPKIWTRKTEEQWLKTLKVQFLDSIFNDYYDLDDWDQIVSQHSDNIKLLVFY